MGDEEVEVMVLSLNLAQPVASSTKEGFSEGTVTSLWIIPERSIHLMTRQCERRQRDGHELIFLFSFVSAWRQLIAFAVLQSLTGIIWNIIFFSNLNSSLHNQKIQF